MARAHIQTVAHEKLMGVEAHLYRRACSCGYWGLYRQDFSDAVSDACPLAGNESTPCRRCGCRGCGHHPSGCEGAGGTCNCSAQMFVPIECEAT